MPFGLLAALLCAATEPLALPLRDHAAERAAKPRKRPGKPATTGVLNVNRATEAELRLLPGRNSPRLHSSHRQLSPTPFCMRNPASALLHERPGAPRELPSPPPRRPAARAAGRRPAPAPRGNRSPLPCGPAIGTGGRNPASDEARPRALADPA